MMNKQDTAQDDRQSPCIANVVDSTISTDEETNLDKSKPADDEKPLPTDSLITTGEQKLVTDIDTKRGTEFDQEEQETISQVSSVVLDETPSIQLQSEKLITEEIEDIEGIVEKRPSTINPRADIISQIDSQSLRPSSDSQEMVEDIQESTELFREGERLTSTDSVSRSVQPIIKSEEEKQLSILCTLSTTNKTTEKTTSNDYQSSAELQSRKEVDEQVLSDSSVNIVHQIGTVPRITDFITTDNETKTTPISKNEMQKPPVESRIKTTPARESIPHEFSTTKTEEIVQTPDSKETLSEPRESSFSIEKHTETTSEEELEKDEEQNLSPEALKNLTAPHVTQRLSCHIETEAVISVEKQDEQHPTDLFKKSAIQEDIDEDTR